MEAGTVNTTGRQASPQQLRFARLIAWERGHGRGIRLPQDADTLTLVIQGLLAEPAAPITPGQEDSIRAAWHDLGRDPEDEAMPNDRAAANRLLRRLRAEVEVASATNPEAAAAEWLTAIRRQKESVPAAQPAAA